MWEAVFRAVMARFVRGDDVGPRLFFLAIRVGGKDKDPRPAFVGRFIDCLADETPGEGGEARPVAVEVLKGSRAKRSAGFITDRRTGRMGTLLRLSSVRGKGKDQATVGAEWVSHARAGKKLICRLSLLGGRWVVTGEVVKAVR